MLGLIGAVGGKGGVGNSGSLLGHEVEQRALGQLLLGVDTLEEAAEVAGRGGVDRATDPDGLVDRARPASS